jgi:hypothetical protein
VSHAVRSCFTFSSTAVADSRHERRLPQRLHILLVGSNAPQHGLVLREQVEAVNLHSLGMVVVRPFSVGRVLHDIASVHYSWYSNNLNIPSTAIVAAAGQTAKAQRHSQFLTIRRRSRP